MKNIDKLNKTMEYLSDLLLDSAAQVDKSKKYEEIEEILPTIDKVTTIIKRIVDMGIDFDGEEIEKTTQQKYISKDNDIEEIKESVVGEND